MEARDSKNKLQELDEMTRQKIEKSLPLFFYVLPLIHILIALPLAYYLNIWADEGSTLYTTENGFFQTLQNVFQDEKQAPLYFLILSLWREVNHSIFFARIFSVICSVISITVFFKIVRKFWNEKTAFFTAFFFAVHPYLVFVSLEIRVYALIVLLSLLLIKLFLDGYLERRKIELDQKRKIRNRQILFVVTAIFSLYTNYYLGFLLVGFFIVLIVLRRWPAVRTYFWQMLLAGLAILPLIWLIKMQFEVNTGGHFQATDWLEGLKLLWNHYLTFVLPTEIYTPENQTLISFIRLWLVRFGTFLIVVLLIYKRKIYEGKVAIFGVLSITVFAFLYSAYFLLSELYVEIRHAAVWFTSVCFLLTAAVSDVLPTKKTRKGTYIVWGIAAFLAVFYVYGIYSLYPAGVKRGDWQRIAAYIEKNEKPDQSIIVYSNYEALNLPYYYQGENKILPQENFFKWNYEAEFGSPETWKEQIEYVISVIPKDKNEIWLVTEEGCQTTKACEPLEKFVESNYTIIDTKDFYKERVRLLKRK